MNLPVGVEMPGWLRSMQGLQGVVWRWS